MQLKAKISHWSAGLPVAMLNLKTAEKLGVHAGDRVTLRTISKKPNEMVTIIDTIERIVKDGEIGVSFEIKKILNLRDGQTLDVSFSGPPDSVNYVKKKLIGEELSDKEIRQIIDDVVSNKLTEPEISVFVSGMYRNGMTFKETVALVDAVLNSGKKLHFNNKYVVDKHCIGGIAGNRTTPIVVSICVAAGLTMPKTSSRAITSAAGTADCIEVISPVEFSIPELKKIVQKTGGCLTWGGSLGLAPADSTIIKVEKMLKIDPVAQLLASIMSKKLAAGSKYILIDIPYGEKAKVTKKKGKMLKGKFERLGNHFGVKIKVLMTKATQPIGNGVGPALEMIDVIKVLNPKEDGPKDLEEKAVYLAGEIIDMTGKTKKGHGKKLAMELLKSGKAFEKFKKIIEAQGGKVEKINTSKIYEIIKAPKSGKIKEIDNHLINYLGRVAGCPMDRYAGCYLHHHVGEKVKEGEPLITIYAESKPRLTEAVKYYKEKQPIRI